MPILPNPPGTAQTTGPLVAVLLYDGLCTFEFGIAAEVFGLHRPELGPTWYRYVSCGVEPGPLRAQGGVTLMPDHGPEMLDHAQIIVVPGWKGAQAPVPPDLIQRLIAAHARGARLVSICSGVFVLAATGLLDGATATTHWRYADALQARFPKLRIDAARLYCNHGRVYTSAGSAAGIDLMLDIVRQDYGPAAANSVARRLVVPAHRSGGQAQFLERPVPRQPGGAIGPLLDQMRAALAEDWPSARMAHICAMSLRSFQRRFQDATGMTPGDWLIAERVEAAKALLCETRLSVEKVAATVGFGTAHALRHHFRKSSGLTPRDYRARFLPERRAR